jgi:hypothetical protein
MINIHNPFSLPFSIVKTTQIIDISISSVSSIYATTAYNMPQCTKYQTACIIEASEFNSSGG